MNGPMKLTQADKILDNAKLESGFKLASNELFHTGKVFQARKKSENIQLASMRKVVVMSTAKPFPCSFEIVIPCQDDQVSILIRCFCLYENDMLDLRSHSAFCLLDLPMLKTLFNFMLQQSDPLNL
ncbi:hypothetical protein D5086_011400 [Populus alba]|uniref:Uncharacterized protein n=1 Tax=Populus alba TaxID=43335 RepID=A0ACC4CCW8_POPAL